VLHRRSSLVFATLTLILAFAGPAAAQSAPQPVNELLDGFGSMTPNVCPTGEQPVVNSYSATGTSTGNYHGTFTATGDVYWDPETNTLELRNAGFTIDSPAGRIEATMSSYWPTEEDEFSIYCSAATDNAFQSGFLASWRGVLTAPDGTLWSVAGDVQPYLAAWGDNVWRYTQFTASQEPVRLEPATREDCADGRHLAYGFDNRGACVAHVVAADLARP
jgi:hypothetical protein